MDQKELNKWRKKIGISAPGRYLSQRHPKAPRPTQYLGPHSKRLRVRAGKPPTGTYTRRKFTAAEIETMWLALCRVFDYCGGSRKLLSELTGLSSHCIARYIKIGRFTADAAHIIGVSKDMPFSREEVRPDIDPQGWKDFDVYFKNIQPHRNRRKYETAHRID